MFGLLVWLVPWFVGLGLIKRSFGKARYHCFQVPLPVIHVGGRNETRVPDGCPRQVCTYSHACGLFHPATTLNKHSKMTKYPTQRQGHTQPDPQPMDGSVHSGGPSRQRPTHECASPTRGTKPRRTHARDERSTTYKRPCTTLQYCYCRKSISIRISWARVPILYLDYLWTRVS